MTHGRGEATANASILMSRKAKFLGFIFFILIASYGVITIQYAYALKEGIPPWSSMLTYLSTPGYMTPEPGMSGPKAGFLNYKDNFLVSMSSHFVLGGLVMILGVFQFVPSFRRDHRQIHRGLGVFLFVGMVTVSVSSVIYLVNNTAESNVGGPMFWYLLFGLSGFSFLFLWQAALAIYETRFRDHMVWMGLAYSCYLTAPFLRLNYPIAGNLDLQTFNRVIPSSATSVLMQTILIFGIWLIYVGEHDLPNRKRFEITHLSRKLTAIICVLASMSLVGLVAAIYMTDSLVHFSVGSTEQLYALSTFAVIGVLQIALSKAVFFDATKGLKPNLAYCLATLAFAGATFYLCFQLNKELFAMHLLFYVLISPAIMQITFLVLAFLTKPLSNGVNLFGQISAVGNWVWAAVPSSFILLIASGRSEDISLVIALVLAMPLGIVGVTVYASGISFKVLPNIKSRVYRQKVGT